MRRRYARRSAAEIDRIYLGCVIGSAFCASARGSIAPEPAGAGGSAGVSTPVVVPFHLSIDFTSDSFAAHATLRALPLSEKTASEFRLSARTLTRFSPSLFSFRLSPNALDDPIVVVGVPSPLRTEHREKQVSRRLITRCAPVGKHLPRDVSSAEKETEGKRRSR